MMLSTFQRLIIFKVLRASGLIKEISTNSLSIRKLNEQTGDSNPQHLDCRSSLWIPVNPFNIWMLLEFVLISFIKPDARNTLNIINPWRIDNIIFYLNYNTTIKHATFKYAIKSNQKLVRLAQLVEQWTGNSV